MTVHGDNVIQTGRLLVPEDMSEQRVSQWRKTITLHTAATKL